MRLPLQLYGSSESHEPEVFCSSPLSLSPYPRVCVCAYIYIYVSSICIRNHAHLCSVFITASRFMLSLSSVLQDIRSEWCIPCCRHGRVYLCCKILSHSSMCHYILFHGTTMNPRGGCGLLRPHCSDDHSAHSERASWPQGFSCSRLDFDGR